MNRRQYRHAMRIARTNGIEYTRKFFRSYPERMAVIDAVLNQQSDGLADRAYMHQIGHNATPFMYCAP